MHAGGGWQWCNQPTSDARAHAGIDILYIIARLSVMVRQIHGSSLLSRYICQRSCAFRQYMVKYNYLYYL